jgi:hypothetical protein
MKTKIKIDKIFHNVVQTKRGPADKFTLISNNYGFTGWGKGAEYKEGDEVEIEYDENSKYQTDKYTYFNLIKKNKSNDNLPVAYLQEILDVVLRIEDKLNKAFPPNKVDEIF